MEKLSDRLRELADCLDSCNRDSNAFCSVVPSLTTLKEMVVVMNEAAKELDDWAKAEYER